MRRFVLMLLALALVLSLCGCALFQEDVTYEGLVKANSAEALLADHTSFSCRNEFAETTLWLTKGGTIESGEDAGILITNSYAPYLDYFYDNDYEIRYYIDREKTGASFVTNPFFPEGDCYEIKAQETLRLDGNERIHLLLEAKPEFLKERYEITDYNRKIFLDAYVNPKTLALMELTQYMLDEEEQSTILHYYDFSFDAEMPAEVQHVADRMTELSETPDSERRSITVIEKDSGETLSLRLPKEPFLVARGHGVDVCLDEHGLEPYVAAEAPADKDLTLYLLSSVG